MITSSIARRVLATSIGWGDCGRSFFVSAGRSRRLVLFFMAPGDLPTKRARSLTSCFVAVLPTSRVAWFVSGFRKDVVEQAAARVLLKAPYPSRRGKHGQWSNGLSATHPTVIALAALASVLQGLRGRRSRGH